MVTRRIITPKVAKGFVSRQTNLGVDTYDLDELCSPDTGQWRSKVFHLGSSKYQPQVATAPTRYWFDRSRYNNHGTITGAVWKQLPSGVWVLSFDGTDDKILAGDINAFDGLTRITIIAWVKIDGAGSGVGQDIMVGKNSNCALGMGWTADKVDFYIHDGAWKTSGASSMSITDNAWHFVVGIYDNNTIYNYVDLVLGNSNTIGAVTLTSNAEIVSVGCTAALPSSYTNFLKGNIGEIFAYNRALSVAEFTQIYLTTKWRYI